MLISSSSKRGRLGGQCPTRLLSLGCTRTHHLLPCRHLDVGRLETGPREVTAPELQREILQLEEQEGSLDYKFGVVYCREGQTSDDEMYSNGAPLPDSHYFCT